MIDTMKEYNRISAIIRKYITSVAFFDSNIMQTYSDIATFIDYDLSSWLMEAFKILTLKSIYPLKNDFILPDFKKYIEEYDPSYNLDVNVEVGRDFFSFIDEGIISYDWQIYLVYVDHGQFAMSWPKIVIESSNLAKDLDYGDTQFYLLGNKKIAQFIKTYPSGKNLKELMRLLSSHIGNAYGTTFFDVTYDENSFLFTNDEVFFGEYVFGYDRYDYGCEFLLSTYIVFQELENIMDSERRLYEKQ